LCLDTLARSPSPHLAQNSATLGADPSGRAALHGPGADAAGLMIARAWVARV